MNIFRNTLSARPRLNKFNMSHDHKLSFSMGQIIPTYLQEILPGDRFKVRSEQLIRTSPMLAPLLHQVDIQTHYWFVPNRLVFNMWNDFMTGGEEGTVEVAPPAMKIQDSTKTYFAKGRLGDYFGLPTLDTTEAVSSAQAIGVNALPFRAYAEIWNEFYRDQNLEEKIDFSKDPGNAGLTDIDTLTTIRNAKYMKDYFTSALPWPQRGAEVNMPIKPNYLATAEAYDIAGDPAPDGPLTSTSGIIGTPSNIGIHNLDPDEAGQITINELRNSVRLQEWLEANARGGSRLTEVILQHFGVLSKDSRQQRPEFLGGGRQPLTISEVLQTQRTDVGESPLGELAGHAISVGNTASFKRRFTEHGHVLGLTMILPKTAYTQGIERHWLKDDRLAYYWPKFANLGEQEVYNAEVYYDQTAPADPTTGEAQAKQTFGYQSRYAHYKFNKSKVSGDFRDSLAYWHLARIFNESPGLNSDFITAKPADFDRIFAVTDTTINKIYAQVYNHVKALRPMPYYGIPRL